MKQYIAGTIASAFCLVFVMACSTGPRKLDTEIDAKGESAQGNIGLKNGEVTIQKQTNAADELRGTQWSNSRYEDELAHEYHMLKWCREDVADPRLGGTGEVTPLPEVDNMKQTAAVKEEFGLTENGNLAFKSEEDFLKRIQIERNYQTTLMKMVKTVRTQSEDCERKMGQARLKAGLPAKRYQGQSTVTSEGNVGKVIRRHEHSLDDAFAIRDEDKSGRKPASE
ncbi:hypothetical protein WDW37_11875 [Bdellovibrionota bacterium FG-1]